LIKHIGHENKDDDHQRCNVLMFNQILPISTIRNIGRTVRRICMWILWLKRLTKAGVPKEELNLVILGRMGALIKG